MFVDFVEQFNVVGKCWPGDGGGFSRFEGRVRNTHIQCPVLCSQ